MFVLRNKIQKGYKFGQSTWYGRKHAGTDYQANFADLQIPFNGYVKSDYGLEGGYYIELTRDNGDVITMRHLSKIVLGTGYRVEGEFCGITGNSGALTDSPHLHLEVKVNGKLIDPETYNWERVLRVCVVQQNSTWPSMADKFREIRHRVYELSSNYHLDINIDVIPVKFPNIPFVDYGNNQKGVDQNWLKANLSSFATGYHAVCFLIPNSQTPPHGVVYGFGDGDGLPAFITQVFADENESITGGFGTMNLFVHTFIHENLGHVMKLIDGGPDITHNFLNDASRPSVYDLTGLMNTYNYKNIDKFL